MTGDSLQLSPLGNTRVPNALLPWEIGTLGDNQPGSGETAIPTGPPVSGAVGAISTEQDPRGRGVWHCKAQGGQVGARDGGDSAERVRVVRWGWSGGASANRSEVVKLGPWQPWRC